MSSWLCLLVTVAAGGSSFSDQFRQAGLAAGFCRESWRGQETEERASAWMPWPAPVLLGELTQEPGLASLISPKPTWFPLTRFPLLRLLSQAISRSGQDTCFHKGSLTSDRNRKQRQLGCHLEGKEGQVRNAVATSELWDKAGLCSLLGVWLRSVFWPRSIQTDALRHGGT